VNSDNTKPAAWIGEFAALEVVDLKEIGTFLDLGVSKDLFLPFSEQTRELRRGEFVVVHIYLDKMDRLTASMKIDTFLSKKPATYQTDQPVDLLIYAQTDLGFKAIINHQHGGILYNSEVFQTIHYGQKIKGFIKKVREDGKIDLILQKSGHLAAQEDIGPKIIEEIKKAGGFLAITDKSDADKIYSLFGVSKKKFKIALGGLYKKRLITIEPDGLRMVAP
jgi:predicted RNA-binding protein (virulence factor B family)